MNSGEELLTFGWHEYAVMITFLVVYLLMMFSKNLPSMAAFKDFTDTINSAGGHIILLALFSFFSIRITMHYIFWVIALPGDVVTKSQATIAVGLTTVTSGFSGTFIGALLKTMSGGKANGNTPSNGAPDTLTATVTPEKESH